MKKITGLLLLVSMLVMCFAVTNVSAATNDNLQYLLVDALSWSKAADGATQQFNNDVLKVCSKTAVANAATLESLADATIEYIKDNSTSAKVRSLMADKDAIKDALTAFANAETTSLKSLGKTVQQIYTQREFESATEGKYTYQVGVGGYFGDGLKDLIPDTGAVPGYDFEELRKQLNTALTSEPENNNGLRFALLYLREQVYINDKIGISESNTHISSFDKDAKTFDFYISSYVTTDAAKKQIIGTTEDLIEMLPALKTEVNAKSGDNLTEKFMVYIEDLLNAGDEAEKESFYEFLDDNYRPNEGIIIVAKSSAPTPGGGGGITTLVVTYANTVGGSLDGETIERVRYGNKPAKVPTPVPAEGYVFKGWSQDGGETIIDPATVVIKKKTTFTAIFAPETGEGPFDLSSHYAYMKGYPDGSFRPNGNMTRAEAAVMFSRLLVSKMDINENYDCDFTDIKEDDWFKNHIGYMSRIGAINGYPDGTFDPNGSITRAEFAAMASRFDKLTSGAAATFADLNETHWAYDYISFAADHGWIAGYEDNTVRPDNYITRAEVITITNRMLLRPATAEHTSYIAMPKDFTDVTSTDWYYFDVVESTNDHDGFETVTEEDMPTEEETADEAAQESGETVEETTDEVVAEAETATNEVVAEDEAVADETTEEAAGEVVDENETSDKVAEE